jgi:VWFA-related protein
MRWVGQISNTILSWGTLALLAQSPTPMTVIRVPVHLVTAPTLVFSKEGRLLHALQRTDFRLFDNDRAQRVALETLSTPISVAIVVQVNQDVRQYVPLIARTGSVFDALLVGESGEAAVITYNGDIIVAKPFGEGDVQSALGKISAHGRRARMIDAGFRAIALLKERPTSRDRILLFIGQPLDKGSQPTLADLRQEAQKENVAIHVLTLPEFGKSFVSDTFSLEGLPSRDKGGFKADVDLAKRITILNESSQTSKRQDPFSVLTTATGGTQFRFHKQSELEQAVATLGVELRSTYLLSYSPNSTEPGYHAIRIEVDVSGAKVFARPGYWLDGR